MGMVECEKCEKSFDLNSVHHPSIVTMCLSCNPSQGKDPNWCDTCGIYRDCDHTRKDRIKQ